MRCHALVGYDCSGKNSKYTEISLIDTQPCTPTNRNITKEEVLIQLIQPNTFDQIPYFQCLVEIDHFIFRCGKTIDTNVAASRYSEFFEYQKLECSTLLSDGVLLYEGIKIRVDRTKNLNTVSLETIGKIVGGSCKPGEPTTVQGIFHDRPVRNSVFKIKTYRGEASVDIEEAKVIFETGLKCNYHTGNCFSVD